MVILLSLSSVTTLIVILQTKCHSVSSCPVTTEIAIVHTDGLDFSFNFSSITTAIAILHTDGPLDYLFQCHNCNGNSYNDGHSALSCPVSQLL